MPRKRETAMKDSYQRFGARLVHLLALTEKLPVLLLPHVAAGANAGSSDAQRV